MSSVESTWPNLQANLETWNDMSHIDAMSHFKGPSPSFASPEPDKVRKVLDTTIDLLTPQGGLELLTELLLERISTEYRHLSDSPDWLRLGLERAGEARVVEMLKANWPHIGRTAFVSERFGIPRSTLHRMKAAGAIAYRPSDADDFVFPLEQFVPGTVLPWAGKIIEAVGNGAPALHFLYVSRRQLGDQSFAGALRARRV